MNVLYEIGVRLFYLFMKVYGLKDPKAKAWVKGHKMKVDKREDKCIWIHSASLGEYNQIKPLVALLEESGHEFVFTFFSSSGFENITTKYPKYYLPLDTYQNANEFIAKINPALAIFVRAEYWFNHIKTLEEKKIPLVFVNSFLNKDHYFFKWYGKWSLSKLNGTSFFYTTNKETSELLSAVGLQQNLNLGDTKVDQVLSVKSESRPLINTPDKKKIILGASLEDHDLEIIKNLITNYGKEFLLIIVPHEHSNAVYDKYNTLTENELVKYSELNNTEADLIYVDKFGILPYLYKYAWVSYIGGGFDKGIHNILESCVESTPMIFGPKHSKFPEAQNLIDTGGAISIDRPLEINNAIKYFKIKKNLDHATFTCDNYISANQGASKNIYEHLKLNILSK